MQFGEYWTQFIAELSTRGALSAALSALVFVLLVSWWTIRNVRLLRQIQSVPVRILVTGSRGKSTVVRLIHASLHENKIKAYAKTTGTAACELGIDGEEIHTRRIGQVSILEVLETAKRAFQGGQKPDVMVIECMAVSPLLTKILSHRMFKPTTVIITNALLDHLEEQGKTREEIAQSLLSALAPATKHLITADPYPTNIAIYEEDALKNGIVMRVATTDSRSTSVKSLLRHQHPANVALTLELSRDMNLSDEQTIQGIVRASAEPHDREVHSLAIESRKITFFDLGSINDTDSIPANLSSILSTKTEDTLLIAMLVNRWDRPLRALEFSENLLPSVFHGVVMVGEPVFPCRKVLLENGFTRFQILRLNSFDRFRGQWQRYLLDFAVNLNPDFKEAIIVLLENIHDPVADTVREEIVRGTS